MGCTGEPYCVNHGCPVCKSNSKGSREPSCASCAAMTPASSVNNQKAKGPEKSSTTQAAAAATTVSLGVQRKWKAGKTSVESIPRPASGGLGLKLEERNGGAVYIIRTTKGSPSEKILGTTPSFSPDGLRLLKVNGKQFTDKAGCVALLKEDRAQIKVEVVLETREAAKKGKLASQSKGSTKKVPNSALKKTSAASSPGDGKAPAHRPRVSFEDVNKSTVSQIQLSLMEAVTEAETVANAGSADVGRPRLLPIGKSNGKFGFELQTELLPRDVLIDKADAEPLDRFKHSVKAIEAGGAAWLVGLEIGELILEVDGLDTETLSASGIADAFKKIDGRPAWVLVCPPEWADFQILDDVGFNVERFTPDDSVVITRADDTNVGSTIRQFQVEAAKAQFKKDQAEEISRRRKEYSGNDVTPVDFWGAASRLTVKTASSPAVVEHIAGRVNIPSLQSVAYSLDNVPVRCIGHNLTVTASFTHADCDKLKYSAVLVQTRGRDVIDKVLECQQVKARACIVGYHAPDVKAFDLLGIHDDVRWNEVKIPIFLVGSAVFCRWVTSVLKGDSLSLVSARNCAVPPSEDVDDFGISQHTSTTAQSAPTAEIVVSDSEDEGPPAPTVAPQAGEAKTVTQEVDALVHTAEPVYRDDGAIEISMRKASDDKWGMKLRPQDDTILIKETPPPDSIAGKSGVLKGGMIVEYMNGESTKGMNKKVLKSMITCDDLTLVVRQPLAASNEVALEASSEAGGDKSIEVAPVESIVPTTSDLGSMYSSMRRRELVGLLRERGADYRECTNLQELIALAIATDPDQSTSQDSQSTASPSNNGSSEETRSSSPPTSVRDSNPFADFLPAPVDTTPPPVEKPPDRLVKGRLAIIKELRGRGIDYSACRNLEELVALAAASDPSTAPSTTTAQANENVTPTLKPSRYEGMGRLAIIKELRGRGIDYSACRSLEELIALASANDASEVPSSETTDVAAKVKPSRYDGMGRFALIKELRGRGIDYSACKTQEELLALAKATDSAETSGDGHSAVVATASEADLAALDD